jgi:hypothetical protein
VIKGIWGGALSTTTAGQNRVGAGQGRTGGCARSAARVGGNTGKEKQLGGGLVQAVARGATRVQLANATARWSQGARRRMVVSTGSAEHRQAERWQRRRLGVGCCGVGRAVDRRRWGKWRGRRDQAAAAAAAARARHLRWSMGGVQGDGSRNTQGKSSEGATSRAQDMAGGGEVSVKLAGTWIYRGAAADWALAQWPPLGPRAREEEQPPRPSTAPPPGGGACELVYPCMYVCM